MSRVQTPAKIDATKLAVEFEGKSAEDVIRWALETFGDRVAVSTAFQAEGMAILDMAHGIDPNVSVFTIDTGRLPQETYDLVDRVRDRYGMVVEIYYPDHDELAQMVSKHGINPFYRSVSLRLRCCELRKVNPLKRALSSRDAWISGIRRDQGPTRADISKIEVDSAYDGIIKVNPLADWSSEQVWEYIKRNDVPYNALYDEGYTSIGCVPCTRPVRPGEDPRAGRWWWEKGVPKECGIHISPVPSGEASPRKLNPTRDGR